MNGNALKRYGSIPAGETAFPAGTLTICSGFGHQPSFFESGRPLPGCHRPDAQLTFCVIRLLHAADIHLDTSFSGRDREVRRRLREASREAFRRVVETAVTEEVDVLVIAGDLFDGSRLSFETETLLRDSFRRLESAGIPVVYATGNHDPGQGIARDRLRWPANVTVICDGTPQRIALRSKQEEVIGWLTAAGHHSARETRDLASAFPHPSGDLPEVAVLHTQVVGSRSEEDHEPYAPSTLTTLTAAGYDYWALGHVHLRQSLSDLPAVHYSGNVQGRTHGETGPKGVLIAEVERHQAARVRFIPLAPVRWETLTVRGLEGVASVEQLVGLVRNRWDRIRGQDPDPGTEWMVRVILEGGCPLWKELREKEEQDALARELTGALGVLDLLVLADHVHPVVSVDDHLDREDVLGFALRLTRRIAAGSGELAELEAELAAGSPEGGLSNYLAEILGDAEGEILSRLRIEDA